MANGPRPTNGRPENPAKYTGSRLIVHANADSIFIYSYKWNRLLIRKMVIVGCAAFLFRLLFIFWGFTNWHLMPEYTMSSVYFYQGYGICAGYGYVSEDWGEKPFKNLGRLRALVNEGLHVTPQSAPQLDEKAVYPEMLHPPGMALIIAAIHRITGARAELYFEIIGMLLDTAAACLLCWMIYKFFSERIAFAAGMIYALYPPLAFLSTVQRLSESYQPIIILASLVFVLQSACASGRKLALWWILAGLMVGIGAYLRPDYLLVPVAYGFALWMYTGRFRRSILAMAVMQAVALILLIPWAYRNHQLCGRWIFTATSVGCTLINGLSEYNNAWGFGGLDEDRVVEAHKQGFYAPESPEADLYFQSLFWESIRSKPLGYLMTIVKRLPMAILAPQGFGFNNPYKTGTFSSAIQQGRDRYDVIFSKPWYVIKAYWEYLLMGAVSVAGLVSSIIMLFLERRRFALVFLLLSPHLYAIGVHLLTHYEPIFVLPSMFSFLLGLAYVICRGWRYREASIAA
jgi:4-amino-4-deoxy-L-arabinose transferase-like glycosyltransferase